jgi:hypothetical protein
VTINRCLISKLIILYKECIYFIEICRKKDMRIDIKFWIFLGLALKVQMLN